MITKEAALEKYDACRKAFEESGIQNVGQDAYVEGFLNGVDSVKVMLQDESLIIFPGYGTPVYKFIWERDAVRGYLKQLKHYKSVVSSLGTLKKALTTGTIKVEQREFCKTDILVWGMLTFETREEAEAALEKYRNLKR